jgi:hypothetical protein
MKMKAQILKSAPAIAAVVLLSSIVIGYQACSDIKLNHASSLQSVGLASTAGNFCLNNQALINNTLNVIFVVDMSFSNINQVAPAQATDFAGQRFSTISTFVNQPCVSQNKNNKFAIVGFSDSRFINGVKSASGSCTHNLLGSANSTTFTQGLNSFITMQTTTTNLIPSSSGPMQGTNYGDALLCAQELVSSSVADNQAQKLDPQAYLIFFLTDGQPNDPNLLDPTTRSLSSSAPTILATDVSTLVNLPGARSIQLQPIRYGAGIVSAQESQQADYILGKMATAGNSTTSIQIQNAKDINFCSLLTSGAKKRFQVLNFGVVNLTARMRSGVLYPDSDMDGLTDEQEIALGFKPDNPRSSGHQLSLNLLDGLCPKGLPASQCPQTSSSQIPNLMGLTDQDIASYNPPNPDGLDSDKDGIPDLVEILKGTSPNYDDTQTNLDGDLMTMMQELAVGRDPFFADDNLPASLLVNFTQTPTAATSTCTLDQQPFSVNINNVPLVHTIPVQIDPSDSANYIPGNNFVDHGADDNIIFVYYIIGQSLQGNSSTPPSSFLEGQFIKVNYSHPTFQLGGFRNLGSIGQPFVSATGN